MLLIFLMWIPHTTISQEFLPIQVESNAGLITLDENYIHFEHCGVQRVKLIHKNICCVDLHAWSWVLENTEFHFEKQEDRIWLVRTNLKNKEVIQVYRVLNYKYNDIKK